MDATQAQEEFFRTMNRFRKIGFAAMAGAMTKGEFFLLMLLHKNRLANPEGKGMYVSELAHSMHVAPPAVSRTLRALEQRGLIERTVDRDDRRTTYIVLTEKGEETRSCYARQFQAYSERVFRRMGEEDMETLFRLWNRFADLLAEELSEQHI